MNRNNEAHFNQIPKTNISRSRFKRDQNVKFTFDAGKLIPFYVDEVLPGDTFSVNTAVVRATPTPIGLIARDSPHVLVALTSLASLLDIV